MPAPQHSYETFIRATPAEVWQAITEPQFTRRYFHDTAFESELRPGAGHHYVMADGVSAVDGIVEVVDHETRLVMTWHVLYDTAMADEPPSRVEWLLRSANEAGTVTRVTLRHFDLGLSPLTSDNVSLGWVGIIDSMKSLLETGQGLGPLELGEPSPADESAAHRRRAVVANGDAWALLGNDALDLDDTDLLIETAMTSAYHWRRAAEPGSPQVARAMWLVAHAATVAGHTDMALRYATICEKLTESCNEAADFDRAYALEAIARANALAGDLDQAVVTRAAAEAVQIADEEDRVIVVGDIAAGPWFGLEVDG
ncbi:MAG: hypothetical protein GY708_16495 [Actinomycetia bacterium]|nr:hypothetical protein [Actinomycetes bacterium]MCP4962851.1 hypothetical protein [Actinomycetes bacterium]